jgi:hypothetical protein
MELLKAVNIIEGNCKQNCKSKILNPCYKCDNYASCILNCVLQHGLGVCPRKDSCESAIKTEAIKLSHIK